MEGYCALLEIERSASDCHWIGYWNFGCSFDWFDYWNVIGTVVVVVVVVAVVGAAAGSDDDDWKTFDDGGAGAGFLELPPKVCCNGWWLLCHSDSWNQPFGRKRCTVPPRFG